MAKSLLFFDRFVRFARLVQLHPWLLYYDFIFILLGIGGGGVQRHADGYVIDLKLPDHQRIHRSVLKLYAEFEGLFNQTSPEINSELKQFSEQMGRCRVTLDCLTLGSLAEGNIAVHSVLERRYGQNLENLNKQMNNKISSSLFLECEMFQIQIDEWLLDYFLQDPKVRDFRYLEPESPRIFAKFFENQLSILNIARHFTPAGGEHKKH